MQQCPPAARIQLCIQFLIHSTFLLVFYINLKVAATDGDDG